MKRKQHNTSSKPCGAPRVIEPGRLAEARGGHGIRVHFGDHKPSLNQMQHNETLVRW